MECYSPSELPDDVVCLAVGEASSDTLGKFVLRNLEVTILPPSSLPCQTVQSLSVYSVHAALVHATA